jgi:hypothetical protein
VKLVTALFTAKGITYVIKGEKFGLTTQLHTTCRYVTIITMWFDTQAAV